MLSVWPNRKKVILGTIIGLVLLLPLGFQLISPAGQSRFSGVSIFADSGPHWEALEYRREHNSLWLNRFLHSQIITYGRRFVNNYLSHFSPRFLFVVGDEIARSKVPGMGQLLLISSPFLLLGLLTALDRREKAFCSLWPGWLSLPWRRPLLFNLRTLYGPRI